MQRLTSTLSLALLGACVLLHCSSNDTSDAGAPAVVSDLGQCSTSADASAGKFPHSALPTGEPCTGSTTCHMPIDDCPGDFATTPVGNALNEYDCLCTSGAWSCVLAVQVNDECGDAAVVIPDAGVDASDDASSDASADSAVDALADAQPSASPDAMSDAPFDAGDAGPSDAAGD